MVAAVNRAVAVEATSVKSPVVQGAVNGLAGFGRAAGLEFAGMVSIGVASLAKIGRLCIQQSRMRGTVRPVTGKAILHGRRVLPQIRPPDLSVTFKAFQVYVLCIDQAVCDGPMRVVAVRTFDFALPYRVTGLPQ